MKEKLKRFWFLCNNYDLYYRKVMTAEDKEKKAKFDAKISILGFLFEAAVFIFLLSEFLRI
jgi:hypothetical protein